MGWTTPVAAMDWASSASLASSKVVRVWKGLRSMRSTGISSGAPAERSSAACRAIGAGSGLRAGSRDSRPRPRARRLGSGLCFGFRCGAFGSSSCHLLGVRASALWVCLGRCDCDEGFRVQGHDRLPLRGSGDHKGRPGGHGLGPRRGGYCGEWWSGGACRRKRI